MSQQEAAHPALLSAHITHCESSSSDHEERPHRGDIMVLAPPLWVGAEHCGARVRPHL